MKSFPPTSSYNQADHTGKYRHHETYLDKSFITDHVISMKPDGLGRRIMCLFSAFKASQYLNCRLSVVWPENKQCNCSFSDLFSFNNDIQVYPNILSCLERNTPNIGLLQNHWSMLFDTAGDLDKYVDKSAIGMLLALFSRIDEPLILTDGPAQDYSKVFTTCKAVVVKMANQIQTNNNHRILDSFLDNFGIAPAIQERIDAFTQKHQFHKTLGLHIREGDIASWPKHKRYISISGYQNKLDEIMEDKRFGRIFLSTQSNDTTALFQQMYGDKVFSYSFGDYTRSSVGAQNALIDIILLSKCDLILGSQSAFNTAAALIGDKPLIQI